MSRALRRLGIRRFDGWVGGRRFVIPSGAEFAISEPWMSNLLVRLFALTEGAFVDVGVNLGQTLLIKEAIDPQRAYVGFEPNPACVAFVERLKTVNGLSHCRIVPAGLSDKTAIVTLDLFHEDTDSAASVVPDYRPGQEVRARKDVMVICPADLPADIFAARVGVVKIDVEGAEKEVLEGLEPILRRDRPFISVEILPAYTSDNAMRLGRQEAIERLLARLDYRAYRLSKSPLGFEPIREIGVHGDLDRCEYVMAPAEMAPSLIS